MAQNKILIIDFGGQYNQLIARRVRESGVYSEIKGFESVTLEDIRGFDPKGIIFTGGPQSAYGEGAPSIDDGIFELGVPVLGICYGAQYMAYRLGGKIESAPTSEYGHTDVIVTGKDRRALPSPRIPTTAQSLQWKTVTEGFTRCSSILKSTTLSTVQSL